MIDAQAARRRLAEAREELEETLAASRSLAGEGALGGELSTVDQHPGDIATDLTDRETAQALEASVRAQIARVDAALARVEAGTYGRCEVCSREIELERAEILPAARTCIEHREQEAKLPA